MKFPNFIKHLGWVRASRSAGEAFTQATEVPEAPAAIEVRCHHDGNAFEKVEARYRGIILFSAAADGTVQSCLGSKDLHQLNVLLAESGDWVRRWIAATKHLEEGLAESTRPKTVRPPAPGVTVIGDRAAFERPMHPGPPPERC